VNGLSTAAAGSHGRISKKWGAALAAALISGWTDHTAIAATISFNIPPGPANQILNIYAKQAHVHVSYDYEWTMTTPRVRGHFTKKSALRRLLSETGLEYDFLDGDNVAILPPPARISQPQTEEVRIMQPPPPTGTHISGEPPVGVALINIDQEQIRDSGASTAPELVRKHTQNFNGGPSEDTHVFETETKSNSTDGQGLNLRGLGSRNTLSLIDGRRIAPSGSEASFIDNSMIPLIALDHIELLPDGASAVYGSDAVGGVVNYITKDNYTEERYLGFQTLAEVGSVTRGSQFQYRVGQSWGTAWEGGNSFLSFEIYHRGALAASSRSYANSDLRPYGGPNLDSPASNPGTLMVGNDTYAIPSNQRGTALSFSDLTSGTANLSDLHQNAQILPDQEQRSFFGGIHQELSDKLMLFGTLLWSDRYATEAQGDQRITRIIPASNPFLLDRPADGVEIAYDLAADAGVLENNAGVRVINLVAGVDFMITPSWKWSTSIGEALENEHQRILNQVDTSKLDDLLATTLNLFGAGTNINATTLGEIRVEPRYASKSELREIYSAVNGQLHEMSTGPLRAAFGLELRYQRFATELSPPRMTSNLTRHLYAGFAEVRAPLLGRDFTLPGFQKLEVSAEGRYESYSDFGVSFTPKFGIELSLPRGFKVRGTWGKSFRAPNPGDLNETSNVSYIQSFADAASPSGSTQALVVSGKYAGLTAERATSGTVGIDFASAAIPGFRLSSTYFHTASKDRIQGTDYSDNILNDSSLQGIVTPNPSETFRGQICSDLNNHFTPTPRADGSLTDCLHTPIGAIVDLRLQNLGTLIVEGIDLETAYGFDSLGAHVALSLESTYLLDYSLINMPGASRERYLNTEHYPINWKVLGGMKWSWPRVWGRIGLNYSNSYRDIDSVPQRNIASDMTFDLQLGYEFTSISDQTIKSALILNIENIADRKPPFAVNGTAMLGYDEENADPNGRTIKLDVQFSW
jgi:iron complex outermembrane recepter protein